jgi:hypothetical protein
MRKLMYLLLITQCLTACAEKDAPPKGILTTGQEKVLKDAKGVENKLLEADQAQRKSLEKATE